MSCVGHAQRYMCGSYSHGGHHACSNSLHVSRSLVEKIVLREVVEQLLSPAAIALATKEVQRLYRERQAVPKAPQQGAGGPDGTRQAIQEWTKPGCKDSQRIRTSGDDAIIRKHGNKLTIEAAPPRSLLGLLPSLKPLGEELPSIPDETSKEVDI